MFLGRHDGGSYDSRRCWGLEVSCIGSFYRLDQKWHTFVVFAVASSDGLVNSLVTECATSDTQCNEEVPVVEKHCGR